MKCITGIPVALVKVLHTSFVIPCVSLALLFNLQFHYSY